MRIRRATVRSHPLVDALTVRAVSDNYRMPGYFTDGSMIRRVHREQVLALSGARALLMQAAHPVAFAGFFMSTGRLDRPYERLQRTARVIDTVFFGERAVADRATAAVRRWHSERRGALPETVWRFPSGPSRSARHRQ